MSQWYYADRQRQQHGPLETEQLSELFRSGQIDSASLVWREGLEQWQPLSSLRHELNLAAPSAPTGPVTPHDTNASTETAATSHGLDVQAVAAPHDSTTTDLPEADTGRATLDFRQPVEPVSSGAYSPYAAPTVNAALEDAPIQGGEVVLAGFWKRVAAYLIDSLVVGVASAVLGFILGLFLVPLGAMGGDSFGSSAYILGQIVIQLISVAISAGYYAWFHASRNQATLGKMAIGIKVVRTDGSRISLARGVGRYFATILSAMIVGIGFLMAAFTERKQGLHDMLCDTLVVDKWAYTEHPEWQRRELGTVALVVLILYGILLVVLGIAMVVALGALMSLMGGGWN